MIRRRLLSMFGLEEEEGMINDSAFIGIYTLEDDITNDITLNSVLADFKGCREIWIKKDIDGVTINELLAIIFVSANSNDAPYWVRRSPNGELKSTNTTSADWYLIAPAGTQFYRFNGLGG